MDHPTSTLPRLRPTDLPLLILTGLGFPLSQLAIRVMGRRGAALVEAVTGALLVRDIQLLSTRTARRSRPVPAALLYLEIGVACIAAVLGLRSLTNHGVREAIARKPGTREIARRVALGTLFGLHTWRLAIGRDKAEQDGPRRRARRQLRAGRGRRPRRAVRRRARPAGYAPDARGVRVGRQLEMLGDDGQDG